MQPSPLIDPLLWFLPLVLLLAFMRAATQGWVAKLYTVFVAFALSVGMFGLFQATKVSRFPSYGVWLYLGVATLALLPFLFPQKTNPTRPKNSYFFVHHTDLLFLLLLCNGLVTAGIYLAYLGPLQLSWSFKVFFALAYCAYVLIPLYVAYSIAFWSWPGVGLRLVVWFEGIRIWLLAINLAALLQTKKHLFTASAQEWLFHWQSYPVNNKQWTNRHFITVLLLVLLFVLGLQVLMQWLYLKLKHWDAMEDVVEKIFATETYEKAPLFSRRWRGFFLSFLVLVFACSFVWIGLEPRVETMLYERLPVLSRLHISLRSDRKQSGKQFRLRAKHFRYPAVNNVWKSRSSSRPDILIMVVRSLGHDSLREANMPRWTRIVASTPTLVSPRHVGGTGQYDIGLQSLLYSLDPYRLDHKLPVPWPLQQLRKLGYRIEALVTRRSVIRKELGFDRIVSKPTNQEIFSTLANRLQSKPEKGIPTFTLVTLDLLPSHVKRSSRTCRRYRNALERMDQHLSTLWEKALQHRIRNNLSVVWTGESGWFEGRQIPTGVNWLKHGTVPFVLMAPHLNKRSREISGHVDVFPTLFASMGSQVSANKYSDGRSLLNTSSQKIVRSISRPLSNTPGVAVMSFPFSFFLQWDKDMRQIVRYPYAYTGGVLRPSRRTYLLNLDLFEEQFSRFLPNLKMWSERPFVVQQEKVATLKQKAPCDVVTFSNRQLHPMPFVPYLLDATIGDRLRVIGYEVDHRTASKGQVVRIRLTVKVLKRLGDWRVFAHLWSEPSWWFSNVTHQIFPDSLTRHWKPGQIIQRVLSFKYPHHRPVIFSMGLWSAKTRGRMPVISRGRRSDKLKVLTIYPSQQ